MDPDPAAGSTHLTQEQALAAAGRYPLFSSATKGRPATVRYGLFTDKASFSLDASGKPIPAYSRMPAWMILYRHVPWSGEGGGPPVPGASAQPPPSRLADLAIVVADNRSGLFLAGFAV